MRLNKFISHNSSYSRREADLLIKSGQVKIGQSTITQDFYEVKPEDKVFVKNQRIRVKTQFVAIAYHKDKAQLVTHKDDRERKTIFHALPQGFSSFHAAGRLDYTSTGLLILSSSPVVATALERSKWNRKYLLKVRGDIDKRVITAMEEGVRVGLKGAHELNREDNMELAPFASYELKTPSGGFSKLKVEISEGKNRELRRFFAHFDLEVMELKRVSYGPIQLGTLKPGKWRYLERKEYEAIRELLKDEGLRY